MQSIFRRYSPKQAILAEDKNGRGNFATLGAVAIGLLTASVAQARDINTLASNANCDEVTIRQELRPSAQGDSEKVDWFALDRKQREYTGQELLPEHKQAAPEHDTITGCAIKNEVEAAAPKQAIDDNVEMTATEREGTAASQGTQTAEDPEESEGTSSKTEAIKAEPEKSIVQMVLSSETSLIVQFVAILSLAGLLVGVAFGLNYLSKVVLGLIRRRRVCMIPVSLNSRGQEVTGHITILGLNCSRFVPDGKDQIKYLQSLLKDPNTHYFNLEVGDLTVPVFIDGMKGFFTPCAFDKRLSVRLQKALLAHSKTQPSIGQLIAVPHDIKRHKAYIKARKRLAESAGGAKAVPA